MWIWIVEGHVPVAVALQALLDGGERERCAVKHKPRREVERERQHSGAHDKNRPPAVNNPTAAAAQWMRVGKKD